MEIKYHSASEKDIPVLVELRMQFALELSGNQNEQDIAVVRKQLIEYFTQAMKENSCISVLATCDGNIAGIGSVVIRQQAANFKNPTGKWGYIMNMFTIKEYRRKGICKRILNELIKEGSKMGILAFELNATPEGEMVYSKNGFEIHPEPTFRKYLVEHDTKS